MTIINVSDTFQIFPDDLKTFDKLPKGTYTVRFNKMEGFSLIKRENLTVDEKMYGNHKEKAEKALKTFGLFDRSMGIILSGDKGIGKTMFTRYLANQFVETKELPVILIDQAYFGIADFLSSIKQEAMILFDEFEKVFDERNDNSESQDSLLGLFDGLSSTKHMYVITVNDLHRLSSFMQNRTGRFHYHFRFKYPRGQEVRDYIHDHASNVSEDIVEKIVDFSTKVKVTFDTLRSIAFEVSNGNSFSETVEDLNISQGEATKYAVTLRLEDGRLIKLHNQREIDLFDDIANIDGDVDGEWSKIRFETKNAHQNATGDGYVVKEFETSTRWNDDKDEYVSLAIEEAILTINNDANIKYLV